MDSRLVGANPLSEPMLEYCYFLYGFCGYKAIGHHRVKRAGGGVAVCVQGHVYFKERPDLSYFDEDCETVFIEMEKGHQL